MRKALLFLALWSLSLPAIEPVTVLRMGVDTPQDKSVDPVWRQTQAIFADANVQLTFVYLPANPARLLRMLSQGEVDVLPEASMRQDRLDYAWYSEAYRTETSVLLVNARRADRFPIQHLDDIVKNGWYVIEDGAGWYGKEWAQFREKLVAAKLNIPAGNPEDDARSLQLDRADIMLATDAKVALLNYRQRGLAVLPYILNEEPVYYLFSKKTVNAETISRINLAIKKNRLPE